MLWKCTFASSERFAGFFLGVFASRIVRDPRVRVACVASVCLVVCRASASAWTCAVGIAGAVAVVDIVVAVVVGVGCVGVGGVGVGAVSGVGGGVGGVVMLIWVSSGLFFVVDDAASAVAACTVAATVVVEGGRERGDHGVEVQDVRVRVSDRLQQRRDRMAQGTLR